MKTKSHDYIDRITKIKAKMNKILKMIDIKDNLDPEVGEVNIADKYKAMSKFDIDIRYTYLTYIHLFIRDHQYIIDKCIVDVYSDIDSIFDKKVYLVTDVDEPIELTASTVHVKEIVRKIGSIYYSECILDDDKLDDIYGTNNVKRKNSSLMLK